MIYRVSHSRYAMILGCCFAVIFILLAIAPYDRHDWLLENALAFVFILFLATTFKRFPFSRISYSLIFLFLCLHEVGAHYTYAAVPYDTWFTTYLGFSLNDLLGWERNNFDRLVHFSYGLLLAYPIREMFHRVVDVKGFWGYFLPLDVTMSTSMLFELIEWAAVLLVGGDLGVAYLGTQGDIWDAHKDMGLATIGAVIAMTVTALINICIQHDFAREWAESFRVKGKKPLGEDEIARLMMKKRRAQRDSGDES